METEVAAKGEDVRGAVAAPVAHRRVYRAGALAKEVAAREAVAVGLEMAVMDWAVAGMEVEAEA